MAIRLSTASLFDIDTPARSLLKRIKEVHTNRAIAYKVRRDILRIPRPAVWHAVPHEWAAAMYGLGCSMSILSRSTCVRILWDKHMHGRNLAKHPFFTDDTTMFVFIYVCMYVCIYIFIECMVTLTFLIMY